MIPKSPGGVVELDDTGFDGVAVGLVSGELGDGVAHVDPVCGASFGHVTSSPQDEALPRFNRHAGKPRTHGQTVAVRDPGTGAWFAPRRHRGGSPRCDRAAGGRSKLSRPCAGLLPTLLRSSEPRRGQAMAQSPAQE
jgi:hypothetical protein